MSEVFIIIAIVLLILVGQILADLKQMQMYSRLFNKTFKFSVKRFLMSKSLKMVELKYRIKNINIAWPKMY